MSVDTYLKGKNTRRYRRKQVDDVDVLVAPSLMSWAREVHVEAGRFLLWRRLRVNVGHDHKPT